MLRADHSDAFVSIRYPGLWWELRSRVESSPAHISMKAVMRHGNMPEWMATPGVHVRRFTIVASRVRPKTVYSETCFSVWRSSSGQGLASTCLHPQPIRAGTRPGSGSTRLGGLTSRSTPTISCLWTNPILSWGTNPMTRAACARLGFGSGKVKCGVLGSTHWRDPVAAANHRPPQRGICYGR